MKWGIYLFMAGFCILLLIWTLWFQPETHHVPLERVQNVIQGEHRGRFASAHAAWESWRDGGMDDTHGILAGRGPFIQLPPQPALTCCLPCPADHWLWSKFSPGQDSEAATKGGDPVDAVGGSEKAESVK